MSDPTPQPAGTGDPDARPEPTRRIGVVDPEATNPEGAPAQHATGQGLRLHYAAISDVGRVRKDNQDSGYAGPWLLTVCDGVGGAARGDIASGTAIGQLRRLDAAPSDDLLGQVAGALHRAHDRIAELVDEEPTLAGTSTTATVALFDGHRIGIGHVGDSRAYLYRDGTLTQLTIDHTFVQTLIDEGRITEEEARTHPNRNLILKALDGVHDTEPDLFYVDLAAGDRLFLCSDGACGVLSPEKMADILSSGTPEYAAVELVRASLEAGSTDNVTCLVADVIDADTEVETQQPQLVGAAAELERGGPSSTGPRTGRLFRGHRSGDTGELEPVQAEIPPNIGFAIPDDPLIDPEQMRYAPMAPQRFVWARRVCITLIGLGVLAVALGGFYWWTQQQYYIGEHDGRVAIYRGIPDSVPLVSLNSVHQDSDLAVDSLGQADRQLIEEGIDADDLEEAQAKFDNLAAKAAAAQDSTDQDSTDQATEPDATEPPSDEASPTDGTSPTDGPTDDGADGTLAPSQSPAGQGGTSSNEQNTPQGSNLTAELGTEPGGWVTRLVRSVDDAVATTSAQATDVNGVTSTRDR